MWKKFEKNTYFSILHVLKPSFHLCQCALISCPHCSSQGESELVAKDDNLDAADPNKDKKNQDKDEQMEEEEKEKIHEQGDEVIVYYKRADLHRHSSPFLLP